MIWFTSTITCLVVLAALDQTVSFNCSPTSRNTVILQQSTFINRVPFCSSTLLEAAKSDKKRRRRKNPPAAPTKDPVKVSQETIEAFDEGKAQQVDEEESEDISEQLIKSDLTMISEVAKFEFQKDKEITMGIQDVDVSSKDTDKSLAIPLPDITEARKKKQLEEEMKRLEAEKEEKKVRIKRSDKEAFRKLLEQQPFSDADESLFEEEEYGTVSILLGERTKPFLGIPFGPLQVGHFIGALVIVLMAYIEYPGFPLTNLPTPLRECLQGGLLTVYVINAVLAVSAAFKAKERGQPIPIWVVKTISVGGLAFDQLTQLPTTEEIERAKSVKGKRALKNRQR